ncbi:MAG: hypothetical protein PVH45_05550 [Candidatus Omnitrophota bacterium]|jgi:uncharacterized membrane protein
MEKEKTANLYAILSYLWVLCLIPVLLKKDDKFVLFHAKQGLMLFICEAAFSIIGIIPLLGWFIAQVGIFICGIISIIAIIQVLMGNEWKIPVIGDWAEKITI